MTTLGAALYTSFFVVAALWLFLTPETPADPIEPDDAGQPPDLTNSAATGDAAAESRRYLVTHSSCG